MRQFFAIGTEQFSPNQEFFRVTNGGGRWATQGNPDVIHSAWNVDANADGTVDIIATEAGLNGWSDLGGKGAYDVRAGRC